MTIGERISNKRIELGYSQEDLAKKCGWSSRSSISKIESSGDKISLKKIELVAKALNVSTAYLMGWEDSMELDSNYSDKNNTTAPKVFTIEDIEKILDTLNEIALKRLSAYIEYVIIKKQENDK